MRVRTGEIARGAAARAAARRLSDAQRRMFCYLLALSATPEPCERNFTLAVRASRFVPYARVLRQHVRRRPGFRSIDPARILVGAQGGKDAIAFASAVGTLRFGSMPMEQSPHVQLLRAAIDSDGELSDEQIRASSYWSFAHLVMGVAGGWFGARQDAELVEVTRNFIDWALGRTTRITGDGGSPFEDNILVAAVARSPLYQVIDGHHRVAAAIARGDDSVRVHRTWLNAKTPLQDRLEVMATSPHQRLLRQPVPAPEVTRGWVVETNCADRLLRMLRFLEDNPGHVPVPRYLDVGSSYGWFLGEMKRFGHDVLGIEPDPLAVDVGVSYYGLERDEIVVGGLVDRTEELVGSFDVVSCLNLRRHLHVVGRTEVARLLKCIDRVAARVLFVESDAAPSHGPGPVGLELDSGSLTSVILENTSFRDAIDLGAIVDPVGPWSPSGGCRLLALVR